jgi:hypothetical protein
VEALVGGQDRLAKALTELLQIERREHVTEPLRATPVAFDIERDGQGFINRIVPVYTTGAPN